MTVTFNGIDPHIRIIDLRRFVNICVKEWVLWKTPRKTA